MNQRLMNKIRRLHLWRKINRVTLEDRVRNNEPGNTQSSLESIYQVGCWSERKMLEYDSKFKQNQFTEILKDKILMKNIESSDNNMETDEKAKKE